MPPPSSPSRARRPIRVQRFVASPCLKKVFLRTPPGESSHYLPHVYPHICIKHTGVLQSLLQLWFSAHVSLCVHHRSDETDTYVSSCSSVQPQTRTRTLTAATDAPSAQAEKQPQPGQDASCRSSPAVQLPPVAERRSAAAQVTVLITGSSSVRISPEPLLCWLHIPVLIFL